MKTPWRIAVASVLLGIVTVVMFAWHLYTWYVINGTYGFFWGFVAISTPPLSDIFIACMYIAKHGVFNWYIETFFGSLAAVGLGAFLVKIESNVQQPNDIRNE
jgi:hypothetical protein